MMAAGRAVVQVLAVLLGLAILIGASSRCGAVGKAAGSMRLAVGRLVGWAAIGALQGSLSTAQQRVIGSRGAATLGAAGMGRLVVAMAGSREECYENMVQCG